MCSLGYCIKTKRILSSNGRKLNSPNVTEAKTVIRLYDFKVPKFYMYRNFRLIAKLLKLKKKI